MNTYSRALRHINMKDVKQKHQQKLIENKIKKEQEKKYLEELSFKNSPDYSDWRSEISEQMTTTDVFYSTLPAIGDVDLANGAWGDLSSVVNTTISGNTLILSGDASPYRLNGALATVTGGDEYDTLVIDVNSSGTPYSVTDSVPPYSSYAIGNSSNKFYIPFSKSLKAVITADAPNTVTFTVTLQRRFPKSVFVSLDSPEASSFIRTDPIQSNLSPQERRKRLEDMLDAGDEYLLKQLGIQGSTARPADTGNIRSWEQAAQEANEVAQQKYQQDLAAYEKALADDKQKSAELSKAVAAARAVYLKRGQSVAQRQQSYDKLQAAIKAGTDHALSTLRNPIIKPTPPTPPASQPQPKFTSKQLADIDKQIKELEAEAEKNKQDAQNTRWKAAAQLAGEIALGAAGLAGAGVGLAAGVRAIKTAQTVSQVRKATRAYNTYKALEKIKDAAATKRMTSSGKYTAKPNPNRTPVKGGGMYKDSYEPQGQVISEKKLKSPKEVLNNNIPGYYDGKPAPLGFPETPPPEMKNGMHPDLVDGKKVADRFNRLDPISAKAMPLTGNPHIDKKVKTARKKPK